jgi:hypothetical protein
VKQADMRVSSHDLFAIELENQPQHTMSRWMLWPEIDRVMADFASLVGVTQVGIGSVIGV